MRDGQKTSNGLGRPREQTSTHHRPTRPAPKGFWPGPTRLSSRRQAPRSCWQGFQIHGWHKCRVQGLRSTFNTLQRMAQTSTSENTFSDLSVNDHGCGGRGLRARIKDARSPEGSWPLQASPRRHPNMAMNCPRISIPRGLAALFSPDGGRRMDWGVVGRV